SLCLGPARCAGAGSPAGRHGHGRRRWRRPSGRRGRESGARRPASATCRAWPTIAGCNRRRNAGWSPQAMRFDAVIRRQSDNRVLAVLGPTNTGKTHLAVERMLAHDSGTIGLPLRLLAREIYDRIVTLKGPQQVALITGEEKLRPKQARWLVCTVES